MVGRKLALTSAAALALLALGVGVTGGCDSTVTSVGAWQPIITQPVGGSSGGSTGGSAGGSASGSGAVSGAASGAETGGSDAEAGAGAGGAAEVDGPGLYLEAENAQLTSDPSVADGGYAIIEDKTASGGKYILPPASLVSGDMHGSAIAHYSFSLEQAGAYLIWGRIYTPDITSNRMWFQIDGGAWTLWRLTVGSIWYWHPLHNDQQYDNPARFNLAVGQHELAIANSVPNARLDKLYVTSFGDTPPGNNTPCHPPHTIDFGGGDCHPSCGLQAKPNMPTSCNCSAAPMTFPAYDCTSGLCCFGTMP